MRRPIIGFLHAVPWLMLAATMRIIYATDGGLLGYLAFLAANIAILLAFLLVAHHMIEMADGRTELGRLAFDRQLAMARNIVIRITILLAGLSFCVAWLGAPSLSGHLLYGFDGIAFDQHTWIGMVLSSILAAVVLLMALASAAGRRATVLSALRELAARWKSMLPAIAAVAAFLIILSAAQGIVRGDVQQLWQTAWVPYDVRALVYFVFIFSFATLRLCGCLAILVLGLRRSYSRGERDHAANASPAPGP
jgi:hypothetical protein